MSLAVLNGNRAYGLYERFGFVAKKEDIIEECCGTLFTYWWVVHMAFVPSPEVQPCIKNFNGVLLSYALFLNK